MYLMSKHPHSSCFPRLRYEVIREREKPIEDRDIRSIVAMSALIR